MGSPDDSPVVTPMPTPITREELQALLTPLKEGVDKCVEMLETQNSRIHKAETKIAILEDRQPSRQAATWGAGAGGFVAVLIVVAEWLMNKM